MLLPGNTNQLIISAISHYWTTRGRQKEIGARDQGSRAEVTGGKHMDGFIALIEAVLLHNGVAPASIFLSKGLELPGFYRPTKKWDIVVVHDGMLLGAIELKSQVGPSFGNNFNNRSEEAIGSAHDFATAFRDGAFGRRSIRPWLGSVMLLEECAKSTSPVSVSEPHFKVFPEFVNASYAQRYEILLRKLVAEKLYDGVGFVTSRSDDGAQGVYAEPNSDLTIRRFLSSLAGQVRGALEG